MGTIYTNKREIYTNWLMPIGCMVGTSQCEEEEESIATNVDETFRSKLDDLFGPVSP